MLPMKDKTNDLINLRDVLRSFPVTNNDSANSPSCTRIIREYNLIIEPIISCSDNLDFLMHAALERVFFRLAERFFQSQGKGPDYRLTADINKEQTAQTE